MEEIYFRQVQRAVGQGAGAPVTRQRNKNMRFGIFFASFWILNIYFLQHVFIGCFSVVSTFICVFISVSLYFFFLKIKILKNGEESLRCVDLTIQLIKCF